MSEETWVIVRRHDDTKIEVALDDNGVPYQYPSEYEACQSIANEINTGAMQEGVEKAMELETVMQEQDLIQQRLEVALTEQARQGIAPHEYIKSKGFKNLKEVSIMSGKSSKQICRWYENNYDLFLLVVDACLFRKAKHRIRQELKKLLEEN